MAQILHNLEQIKNQIEEALQRSGRKDGVSIIAVTKSVSVERTKEAVEAGLSHLGENRPEGLNLKYDEIGDSVNWHFIGSLQSRKVKEVIDHIDFLHSLDRLNLAKEIQKRASRVVNCFVQVNVSGEESKHGIAPDEVIPFIKGLEQFDKIRVMGLMTMAPNTENETIIRSVFKELKSLQEKIAALQLSFAPCTECSMGMSNDFAIAVEEGATFVRIGTALVGEESGETI